MAACLAPTTLLDRTRQDKHIEIHRETDIEERMDGTHIERHIKRHIQTHRDTLGIETERDTLMCVPFSLSSVCVSMCLYLPLYVSLYVCPVQSLLYMCLSMYL